MTCTEISDTLGAHQRGLNLRIVIIVGGIGVFIGAKSAIHEFPGSLSFGIGILSIALGVATGELATIGSAPNSQIL